MGGDRRSFTLPALATPTNHGTLNVFVYRRPRPHQHGTRFRHTLRHPLRHPLRHTLRPHQHGTRYSPGPASTTGIGWSTRCSTTPTNPSSAASQA